MSFCHILNYNKLETILWWDHTSSDICHADILTHDSSEGVLWETTLIFEKSQQHTCNVSHCILHGCDTRFYLYDKHRHGQKNKGQVLWLTIINSFFLKYTLKHMRT